MGDVVMAGWASGEGALGHQPDPQVGLGGAQPGEQLGVHPGDAPDVQELEDLTVHDDPDVSFAPHLGEILGSRPRPRAPAPPRPAARRQAVSLDWSAVRDQLLGYYADLLER